MLETMYSDFLVNAKGEQKVKIAKKLVKIKELQQKRKLLREEKTKWRGKLLCDTQIHEEYKRRNEENKLYYDEQIEEHLSNMEKKESFIKQFEKKFMEVEIFVRRESKTKAEKYGHFINFEVVKFIIANEILLRRQSVVTDEIRTVNSDLKDLLDENVELKKRDEFIDLSQEYDNQKSKFNSLIHLYMSKIRFLERKNDHLKNVIKVLSSRMDYIRQNNEELGNRIKESNQADDGTQDDNKNAANELFKQCIDYVSEEDEDAEFNEDEIEEEKEKSQMDLSCEEGKDATINNWDISCIKGL
jgi:methyl-accepting chemotaxis protein